MPVRTQAEYRRDQIAKDNFGRPWLLTFELRTGDPTGQILPAKGEPEWQDSLSQVVPPMQYLRVPRDEYGQPVWGRIEIDLARWKHDIEVAEQEWKRQLWRIGQQAYKNKFDPQAAFEDEYLLTLVGPRPSPTVDEINVLIAQATRTAEANEPPVKRGPGRPRKEPAPVPA